MSGNPAPEKVAALAAALDANREDAEGWAEWNDQRPPGWRFTKHADSILAALNAAGYDVARIEEGERPLDVRRLVKAIGNIAKRHGIVKDPPISQSVASIWGYSKAPPEMDAEIAREYAALAASDEAVRP